MKVLSSDIIENLKISFEEREIVEKNPNYIQPIPIVVITNKNRDRVLVVKKNGKDKTDRKDSPEKNKVLLYLGGHIREEDLKDTLQNTLVKTLRREIKEEIDESINTENLTPFLIYTPDFSSKSKKHLAVCYVVEMDLEGRKFKITSDEHIMKTGKSISGHILPIHNILNNEYKNIESWSEEILKTVFNKNINEPSLFNE